VGARTLLPFALVVLSGVAVAGLQPARGGGPIPEIRGEDGTYAFKRDARGDGAPCLTYHAPDEAGGWCFKAVGSQGGWALEVASPIASEHDTVFFGATIRRAARVRIGRVASIRTLGYSRRFKLRFFAGLVPRRALRVHPNRIVALDRRGRLLGRQHYNDGHGHFGRCDGLWDRKRCPHRGTSR
jgi:hypothetical protein